MCWFFRCFFEGRICERSRIRNYILGCRRQKWWIQRKVRTWSTILRSVSAKIMFVWKAFRPTNLSLNNCARVVGASNLKHVSAHETYWYFKPRKYLLFISQEVPRTFVVFVAVVVVRAIMKLQNNDVFIVIQFTYCLKICSNLLKFTYMFCSYLPNPYLCV